MTSFPAFTLFFGQKHSCVYNKKKITRWLEDMNMQLPDTKINDILNRTYKIQNNYRFNMTTNNNISTLFIIIIIWLDLFNFSEVLKS